MPRDMFTDVVDPSIKMGSKAWYTVPLTMAARGDDRRGAGHRSADGGGCPSDAAIDDGVRGGGATAPATAAAATAAAG